MGATISPGARGNGSDAETFATIGSPRSEATSREMGLLHPLPPVTVLLDNIYIYCCNYYV